MIARLTGRLVQKAPDALIVDVHGVGYRVLVSLTAFGALPAEGEEVTLAIHTHLRETALELFGFVAPLEQALFGALITVSGIGPRMAPLSNVEAAVMQKWVGGLKRGPTFSKQRSSSRIKSSTRMNWLGSIWRLPIHKDIAIAGKRCSNIGESQMMSACATRSPGRVFCYRRTIKIRQQSF